MFPRVVTSHTPARLLAPNSPLDSVMCQTSNVIEPRCDVSFGSLPFFAGPTEWEQQKKLPHLYGI